MTFSIERALLDRQLLGAALGSPETWSAWRVVLKAAFGLSLDDEERALFAGLAGDRPPPARQVGELWAVCGQGPR